MDEDDEDMRPVDPNDFFRDRDNEWAVDDDGNSFDDDANESLPRSMAVTDNLFEPEDLGSERRGGVIEEEFEISN